MSVVSWGKNRRYKFISAGELQRFNAPQMPVIFAITYKQNPSSKPKTHTVFYFGHADDLALEMRKVHNDIEDDWLDSGGKMEELHVFMHPMPNSTRRERENVQQKLVLEYSPRGNY